DGDGSHGSTSKTPSYTKSVSWHHYQACIGNIGTHLFNKWTPVIEQKTLSAEPRRSFSNEFKLQMVTLALQPRGSVARIAREHDINDNLLFKWLRLSLIKGRISRRLPLTNSSGIGVELLPVEMTLG
ncbi:transposase, partial [Escherichia coli]|nr:transposase [Escherichia coli]